MNFAFFYPRDLLKDSLSLEQFLLIRITYGELTRGELHLAQVNNSVSPLDYQIWIPSESATFDVVGTAKGLR